ncbi:haloacid dehalogenase [Dictyobacter sp. S3.2.2.5]|uniref:Haloacid dehalogenase n=1 Tax=Dictyobacter halimunensis TaxID=3026934 RepID=A0ABQ6G2Q5_9CHLR|nr:haloacid dehalogenase [Dictyobacter sp. S3.2.2.5]
MVMRALILDFDGLMIETEQPDFQSWQEIYAQYGVTLSLEMWLPLIGTGSSSRAFHPHDHLEALLGRTLDRAELRARRRRRYAELVAARPLLPGVAEIIAQAQRRGLRLAVASSSPREWVITHLVQRGLDALFEHIVCGDEVARAKPFPDVYQVVLARLGLPADQAMAFEDSPNGVQAAKRAGLFCVAIPNPLTQHLAFEQADLRLLSLADFSLADYCL